MHKTSQLPETCTLLLSLDLTVGQTVDQRTYIQTQLNGTDSVLNAPTVVETITVDSDDCLGKGGMGIVTSGTQEYPHRQVAIKKIIKPSKTYQRMLLQEAQIMGHLEHPNIVPVHQIRQNENGDLMVIMKKVNGQTMDALLKQQGTTVSDKIPLIRMLIQVCYALEYSHNENILHRDIKCENIMIGDFNEVLLMDWGLAFSVKTQQGSHTGVVGTPSYIAPEMLTGNPTDVCFQTDVYLLGATLHHILMGTPRHNKKNVAEALEAALLSKPIEYPVEIPSTFAAIMNQACAKGKIPQISIRTKIAESLEEALEHWDAIQLTERARELFIDLQVILKTDASSLEVQTVFMKSRSLLESAMEMWPDNTDGQALLNDLLENMVNHHLSNMEIPLARALFRDISTPSENLQKRFHKKEKEYLEQSEAQALAQQYNPLNSKTGRKTLIVSLVASAVLLISFAGTYSYFVSSKVTTIRLIFTGSVVFIASTVGVIVGRHSLLSNKLGIQMARTLVLTPGLALSNHITGHVYQIDTNALMALDLFIMALTYALLRDIIQSGYRIAASLFILGVIALNIPTMTHLGLLFGILYSTLWALIDWMKE